MRAAAAAAAARDEEAKDRVNTACLALLGNF